MYIFEKSKDFIIKTVYPVATNYKFVCFVFLVINLIVTLQKCCIDSPSCYGIYLAAAQKLHFLGNIYIKTEADYFLYSPTFALLIIPFSFIPLYVGAFIFNLIGLVLLIFAINMLKIKSWQKSLVYVIILFNTVSSVAAFQLNVHVTALCLLTFVFFERNCLFMSALSVALGLFTKIFGIGFGILFLFYKNKIKFLFCLLICITVLFLLPLAYSGFNFGYLFQMYKNWHLAYSLRHNTPMDTNMLGALNYYFNTDFTSIINPIFLCSLVLLALPLLRVSKYKNYTFKLLFLSTLLMWVVLFNPAGEEQSYTIAMTGIAIWFCTQQKPNIYVVIITLLAVVFTALIWTDLCPRQIRDVWFPGSVMAIPTIFIWIIAEIQLLCRTFDEE